MSSEAPFLSLAIICGDAGVSLLPRMLKSVIERADGPLVDEIIVGWNGTKDYEFDKAVAAHGAVPLTTIRQKWEGDFAKARNATFEAARGEWIMWLDTDDVVASIADEASPDGLKALNAVCRQYGIPERAPMGGKEGTTLKTFLRQLPYDTNCLMGCYDYTIGPDGEARVRQRNRRIVRNRCGWIWQNAIHEALYLSGPVTERAAFQPGLLVRHYPSQTDQDRLLRNADIVERLEQGEGMKDHRHAFNLASVHSAAGNWEEVLKSLDEAITKAATKEDVYMYRLAKVTAALSLSRPLQGLGEAFAAIGTWPERQEAYFAAVDCYTHLGEWKSVLAFYELGVKQVPMLDRVDFIVARCCNPHTQAANALCTLGEPEKGIPLCEKALQLVPRDAAAAQTLTRCREAQAKKIAADCAVTLFESLLQTHDFDAAACLQDMVTGSVALREVATSTRFQVLAERLTLEHEAAMEAEEETKLADLPAWVKAWLVDRSSVDFAPRTGAARDAQALMERHGQGSQVLEYKEGPEGRAVRYRKQTKKHITFYCPTGVTAWQPFAPEQFGIGGSETSAIMLGRELAKRGHPVSMYCPGGDGQPNALEGIVWRSVRAFDPAEVDGLLIACRAPFILRNPELTAPCFLWHQDNGYCNPWLWSREVEARARGSLHVSTWARRSLAKELGLEDLPAARNQVIGNGVPADWIWARLKERPERQRHRVIYASDPTRGLSTLLNCWPHVKRDVPDAELHIYCDFEAALRIAGISSTVATGSSTPPIVDDFRKMKRMESDKTLHVFFHGRVPQPQLTQAMFEAGVYAYAGGAMPEGFGVALAQASAAGMAVVYPCDGALPAVLPNKSFMVPGPVNTEAAARIFLDLLRVALYEGLTDAERAADSVETWNQHGWPAVADRFLTAVGGWL